MARSGCQFQGVTVAIPGAGDRAVIASTLEPFGGSVLAEAVIVAAPRERRCSMACAEPA
jgi:hypothetical protein